MTMTDLPPIPASQRVPKPLTSEQQAIVDKRNAELAKKRNAEVAKKLPSLVNKFGAKHQPKQKVKKAVTAFDPFAPRKTGDVNWEAQAKDTSMKSAGGRHKKPDANKKKGK